jgi:hypothetical protein
MHQEIRHSLEDFLRGHDYPGSSELPAEAEAHLGECAECARELSLLREQSQLLRSLRNTESIEPRAGFYARVVERIEAQPASIWSVFLDRKFGFRLALASAALVALLGTYLVTSEPSGPEFVSSPSVVQVGVRQAGAQQSGSPNDESQQQRNAVLVDLASYHQ